MAIPWKTYQSKVSSPDVPVCHDEQAYNPDVLGAPYSGATYDNTFSVTSQALYKNGTAYPYRMAQSVRGTWWADNFDWATEQQFQIEQFAAQFGQRYETGTTELPSYNESRLLYGR